MFEAYKLIHEVSSKILLAAMEVNNKKWYVEGRNDISARIPKSYMIFEGIDFRVFLRKIKSCDYRMYARIHAELAKRYEAYRVKAHHVGSMYAVKRISDGVWEIENNGSQFERYYDVDPEATFPADNEIIEQVSLEEAIMSDSALCDFANNYDSGM